MSATEIIDQIKTLPPEDRKKVLTYFSRDLGSEASLYEEFTLLGSDAEGSDVKHAAAAQAEIAIHERP